MKSISKKLRIKIVNPFEISVELVIRTAEDCTFKACKTIVFHYQICKFVTFLLPSSSWLRKLPSISSAASVLHRDTGYDDLSHSKAKDPLVSSPR